VTDALVPRLEAWRRKLLDLTRRNRLLSFRPPRRTGVRIVDEVPSELYRLVAVEGRTMRFLPREEARGPRPAPAGPDPAPAGPDPAPAGPDPAPAGPDPAPASPTPPTPPGKEPPPPGAEGGPLAKAAPPAGLAGGPPGEGTPRPDAGGVVVRRSPWRCPYCHDAVAAEEEAAVCEACLSRHHADCWGELGRCASCGGARSLVAAPEAPRGGPIDTDSATYRRVAREELPERHRDALLQTDVPAGELEKNLLAIHRRAGSVLEEQGFNTLFLALGFLEWREPGVAAPQQAPILLVPVELRRRALTSKFRLVRGEDDPLLNPALVYKLARERGLALPDVPDDPEALDPDDLFEALAELVAPLEGWRVTQAAHLALFTFNKFVMYKDLEAFQERVLARPLVRRLLGDPAAEPGGGPGDDLPDAGRGCVLDADESQREAIAAVLAGRDLVLEGPPGTGKSQTIANLVAEFLAAGKRVLFVSEKMAALDVVKGRLEEAGLGDSCLELHSRKANKRALVEELARTLEVDPPPDHAEDDVLEAVRAAAGRLDGHVRDLHGPWAGTEVSPYAVLGALEELEGAVDVPCDLPGCSGWTARGVDERERTAEGIGRRLLRLGDPDAHPLAGVGLTELGHKAEVELWEAHEAVTATALPQLEARLRLLAEEAGLPRPETPARAAEAAELARLLTRPDLPPPGALARPEAWTGQRARAAELVELRARSGELRRQLAERWSDAVDAIERPLTLAEELQRLGSRWWRGFAPVWWRAKRRVRAALKPGQPFDAAIAARDLSLVAKARELSGRLDAAAAEGERLFGPAWRADDTEGLRRRLERARELLPHVAAGRLPPAALDRRPRPGVLAEGAQAVDEALAALRSAWAGWVAAARYDEATGLDAAFEDCPLARLRERLEAARARRGELRDWVELQAGQARARELGLEGFLARAAERGVPADELGPALRRAVLLAWLDGAEAERPGLRRFDGAEHGRTVEEFARLDRRQLTLAQVRLRHQLAARRPDTGWAAAKDSELGLLQRELRRKRGHLPIRQLLRRVPTVLADLKPCLFMSPLSVAQFTDPEVHAFDLVLFDEASQIAPEDALGAIARGRQVVVVGDSKQLPPTSFFKALAGEGPAGDGDEEPDLESVLDECVARGMERRLLRWHYRSRHESLIAFSNHHFYRGRLCSFPSPDDGGGRRGLELVRVPDGVYDRGGTGRNAREAAAVAEQVVAHLRRSPGRSLGVGAFSQAQQEAIQDAVEERVRDHPELEPLLSAEREEHFFVKNLENLQGDERDVIYVSIGYGPDAAGKMSLNFGPLNQTGGERRLNVLVTRAREQLRVFASFEPEAIDVDRSQSRGLHLLRAYLDYARTRALPARPAPAGPGPLARASVADAVARALEERGARVVRDLGASDVQLDLAVVDEGAPADAPAGERCLLGVVVDGPHYATFASARDRDRIVPSMLRGLGWRLARVWSLEWHRRRERVLGELLGEVEAARAVARERATARLARRRAAAAAAGRRPGRPHQAAPRGDADDAAAPDGARPYAELVVRRRGDAEAFEAADDGEVADVLRAVVAAEGPIHEREAERRVLAHWDLTRSGKRSRRVQDAVDGAAGRGEVVRRGAFVWPADADPAAPAVRDRSEAGPRDLDLIPPEEVAAALELVAAKEYRLPVEALVLQAARQLGFGRVGQRMRAGFEDVVEELVAGGRLAREDDVVGRPDGAVGRG